MGRTILVVVLTAMLMQAQEGNGVPRKDRIWEHIQAERAQRVLVDPQYTELRRGTEEGFFLRAKIDPTGAGNGALYWGAPSPRNGRIAATILEIEAPKGLVAQSVLHGPVKKVRLRAGAADFVMGPGMAEFHFKLWAPPGVAVGDYVLKGRLRFQPVGQAGVSAEQELRFDVPVHVVERKSKVGKNEFYESEMTPWDWVRVILLIPLAPFFLPNC